MLIKNTQSWWFSDYNCFEYKNSKVGNKIPNVYGLVTTAVLDAKVTEVKNKIPDVSGLVRKTDYDAKISETGNKYLTSSYYNKKF